MRSTSMQRSAPPSSQGTQVELHTLIGDETNLVSVDFGAKRAASPWWSRSSIRQICCIIRLARARQVPSAAACRARAVGRCPGAADLAPRAGGGAGGAARGAGSTLRRDQ